MRQSDTCIIDRRDFLEQCQEPTPSCIVFIHPPGPLIGKLFPLTKAEHVIGRDPDADVTIDQATVSRHHAVIKQHESSWTIEDLGSTNGILVNNRRLKEAALQDHDIVSLGDAVFKFLTDNNVEVRFHDELYRITVTDALTQIHNRRYFFECLERELAIAGRYGTPVSVIMMDVDHFKKLNDRYGHTVGDQVLRALADRVRPRIRREDVFARYGGEEFVIMLSHTALEGGSAFATSLNKLIAARPFSCGEHEIEVTASMGVATHPGCPEIHTAPIVERADLNLLQAKQRGRNCVVA